MGVVRWAKVGFGDNPNATVAGTGFSDSGVFTSSGTASNITSLTLGYGELLEITTDTNGWINFGGTAAASGTGQAVERKRNALFSVWQG